MKKIIIIAAFAAAALSSARLSAQSETFPSFIEVSGYAEKEVAPDVFYMRIDIREIDSKGKKTVEQQQRTMVAVLKSLGIDTEKQLTRLSLSSTFYNKRTNMASAAYQLKLKSADDVSKVWERLDAEGISDISFTKAECSRIDEFREEVRREAARNARKQAESMAEAIDQSIGQCFYMYCGGTGGNTVVYAQAKKSRLLMSNDMAESAGAEESAIEFNTIKLSMSVQAKFVLNAQEKK